MQTETKIQTFFWKVLKTLLGKGKTNTRKGRSDTRKGMQQITSVLVTGVWSFNYGGKYKAYVSELSCPRRKEAKLLVGECFLVLISQKFWPALYLGWAPACSFWTVKWEVLRNKNRALRMCSHTFQNKSWLLFLNNLRIWIIGTFTHCILPPPSVDSSTPF